MQQLASEIATNTTTPEYNLLSGMVLPGGEVVPASMFKNCNEEDVSVLTSSFEEADLRMILHMNLAVGQGATRLLVLCNDTDVVALILRYVDLLMARGLREIWISFGVGEKLRFNPLHHLSDKLGPPR